MANDRSLTINGIKYASPAATGGAELLDVDSILTDALKMWSLTRSYDYLNGIQAAEEYSKEITHDFNTCNCSSVVHTIHFPQIQDSHFKNFLFRVRKHILSKVSLLNSNNTERFKYESKFRTQNGAEIYNPHPVFCIQNGYIIVRLLHGLGDQMYVTVIFVV